jgi:hypothetical protein
MVRRIQNHATITDRTAPGKRGKMNLKLVCATIFVSALGVAGCASKSTDTYKGEAVESGSLLIKTPDGKEAKNVSPPKKLENQTVVVNRDGHKYSAKFGTCELTGESSTSSLAVVKNSCDVTVAKADYKLPLSATLSFGEGGSLKMEVIGTQKNDSAVVTYQWEFTGKK